MADLRALSNLAVTSAEKCLRTGELSTALEWIERVAPSARPPELAGEIHYRLGREEASHGRWQGAEHHFKAAVASAACGLYHERLRCHRARAGMMESAVWDSVSTKVDPAVRLDSRALEPDLDGAYACGAYFSRGALRSTPWSQLLRLAKEPADDEDHAPALKIAGDYLCRFILMRTPLVSVVDVALAVPANPIRFAKRMMSLPDELARSVQHGLGVPFLFDAIRSTAKEVELRGLSWAERRRAVRDSMECANLGIGTGKSVLIIDDVITSGATMREAARLLREGGAEKVYAIALSHTEG